MQALFAAVVADPAAWLIVGSFCGAILHFLNARFQKQNVGGTFLQYWFGDYPLRSVSSVILLIVKDAALIAFAQVPTGVVQALALGIVSGFGVDSLVNKGRTPEDRGQL